MKIAYIVPSSGGSFYCGNCIRDLNLIDGLRRLGQDITVVPMYLPLLMEEADAQPDTPVFYGAVGLYLRHQFHWINRAPEWVDRMLDSPLLLNLAAGLAGSTRASGLGEMTLSMLQGEHGGQAQELERLVSALRDDVKPDVVHLSNALLLGTAHRIKAETPAAIVCSLQDEDSWIEALDDVQVREAKRLLSEASTDVEIMLPVSSYYAAFFREYAALQAKHMEVVPIGVDVRDAAPPRVVPESPTIGYLARMSEDFGLDILVEAVREIKTEKALNNLGLWINGGRTGDDKTFFRHLRAKIRRGGIEKDVHLFQDFSKAARSEFFAGLSLFCLPSRRATAFGLPLLEAMAAGVPVVQPDIGAYPEIVDSTGGGILYRPNNTTALAAALKSLLLDGKRASDLGQQGQAAVRAAYNLDTIAEKMVAVYRKSMDLR